jgi:hypothetical protein
MCAIKYAFLLLVFVFCTSLNCDCSFAKGKDGETSEEYSRNRIPSVIRNMDNSLAEYMVLQQPTVNCLGDDKYSRLKILDTLTLREEFDRIMNYMQQVRPDDRDQIFHYFPRRILPHLREPWGAIGVIVSAGGHVVRGALFGYFLYRWLEILNLDQEDTVSKNPTDVLTDAISLTFYLRNSVTSVDAARFFESMLSRAPNHMFRAERLNDYIHTIGRRLLDVPAAVLSLALPLFYLSISENAPLWLVATEMFGGFIFEFATLTERVSALQSDLRWTFAKSREFFRKTILREEKEGSFANTMLALQQKKRDYKRLIRDMEDPQEILRLWLTIKTDPQRFHQIWNLITRSTSGSSKDAGVENFIDIKNFIAVLEGELLVEESSLEQSLLHDDTEESRKETLNRWQRIFRQVKDPEINKRLFSLLAATVGLPGLTVLSMYVFHRLLYDPFGYSFSTIIEDPFRLTTLGLLSAPVAAFGWFNSLYAWMHYIREGTRDNPSTGRVSRILGVGHWLDSLAWGTLQTVPFAVVYLTAMGVPSVYSLITRDPLSILYNGYVLITTAGLSLNLTPFAAAQLKRSGSIIALRTRRLLTGIRQGFVKLSRTVWEVSGRIINEDDLQSSPDEELLSHWGWRSFSNLQGIKPVLKKCGFGVEEEYSVNPIETWSSWFIRQVRKTFFKYPDFVGLHKHDLMQFVEDIFQFTVKRGTMTEVEEVHKFIKEIRVLVKKEKKTKEKRAADDREMEDYSGGGEGFSGGGLNVGRVEDLDSTSVQYALLEEEEEVGLDQLEGKNADEEEEQDKDLVFHDASDGSDTEEENVDGAVSDLRPPSVFFPSASQVPVQPKGDSVVVDLSEYMQKKLEAESDAFHANRMQYVLKTLAMGKGIMPSANDNGFTGYEKRGKDEFYDAPSELQPYFDHGNGNFSSTAIGVPVTVIGY